MKPDEKRTFEIDPEQKKNCRLPVVDKKIKIEIQKEDDLPTNILFSLVEQDRADAYVVCMAGTVPMLKVYGDATECGIGKMLMQLCFNEEQIHNIGDKMTNTAIERIKEYLIFDGLQIAKEMETWVKSKCKKILYLTMTATPASAAHLYFNSAFDAGFTEMFIAPKNNLGKREFYPKEGPCAVKALQKRYTVDGYMRWIRDEVRVIGQDWFFCKPKTPTLHPKCT